MTLHAGECHCPHFVAQSIAFGIKRNGHVTALSHEPALLQSFIENGVTGELCLTSNLQTKAAPTIEDFPYLKMKSAGARISINTDNRTVSDTDLTKEYARISKLRKLTFTNTMSMPSRLPLLVKRKNKTSLED